MVAPLAMLYRNVKMPGFTLGNIDADVTKVVVTVAHDGRTSR